MLRRLLAASCAALVCLPALTHAQTDGMEQPATAESATGGSAAQQATTEAPVTPRAPTEAELAEARHAFEIARQAFDAGEFDTAATEFRTAFELSHNVVLLYDIYLAEERLGHLEEAERALSRYLAEGQPEPERRSLLEGRLARLRARIAARAADPRATDASDTEGDALLDVPEAGGPQRQPPREEWRETGPSIAAIATLAVAGVLALSFGVFAVLSEVEDQALASECGRDAGRFCTEDRLATLLAYDVAADVSWITAAVAGGIGVALLVALPPERERVLTSIAPFADPTSAGVVVRGRL